MKKNVIITAGPTNERIDSVMKITNMSTGALGSIIGETLLERKFDEIGTIFYISTKMTRKPRIESDKIVYVTVESTQDLIDALRKIFSEQEIHIMIHSAAVGDYLGKYVIRAEDLIDEIFETIQTAACKEDITKERLLKIFENPSAVCNNDTKISSYEPHLMTMLGLTPKVIGLIKKMAPDVTLVGFKLLDGVDKNELNEVATRLRVKNDANYIVANDLSKIGNGKHWAMILDSNGVVTECNTKKEIAESLTNILF
ncbi:MAG: hypothetical protein IKK43_06275 [Clostridia bacterium]|nr:hypothetical protein [Clostridia bacterium]